MPVATSDEKPASQDTAGHGTAKTEPSASKPVYTCPMHPEVRQDHPGNYPKCGMTLELKTATAGPHDEESAASLATPSLSLILGIISWLPY